MLVRATRSYNLHSGLLPLLVFPTHAFSNKCWLYLINLILITVEPDSNGRVDHGSTLVTHDPSSDPLTNHVTHLPF